MTDICTTYQLFEFEADDLIYNRFDLIYQENIERFLYEYEGRQYAIDVYCQAPMAKMNIWGKQIPLSVFENAVSDIFNRHSDINCIEIKQARNNYHQLLEKCNDIRVPLPETVDQLLQKVKAKHRTTIKRMKKHLEEEYGKLDLITYKSEIPDEIVNLYFRWKQITYGKDYNMTPREYLKKYYVTDATILKAGNKKIAILFFCQVDKIVYLENLSYNIEVERFSPGYLMYEMFLEELINRKCTSLYLGGGEYIYKRRFGAEESVAYSGIIYRKEVFDDINKYFNIKDIKRIAIYGLGVIGHSFLRISSQLNINILYGIDRKNQIIDELPVYNPADQLEDVDAVIITIKNYDIDIENFLKLKFNNVYYWKDIIEMMIQNK